MDRIRRLLKWLASPRAEEDEQWSAGAYHCPKCGQELPARRPGATASSPLGPMWLPPNPQELVAKCPFDGHGPFNNEAKAMLADGTLKDTRQAL